MLKRKIAGFEIDAIKEVITIGAANSSTSLSELVGGPVDLLFPNMGYYHLEEIPPIIGKPCDVVTSVVLAIEGEDKGKKFPMGVMMMIFPEKDAIKFTNLLCKTRKTMIDDTGVDAMKETCNIMSGSCLTNVTEFLRIKMTESLPEAATDMLGSLMDPLLAGLCIKSDEILTFSTSFNVKNKDIRIHFVVFFDPDIMDDVMDMIDKSGWLTI
jgi:chemotaxis protein CheY-P-specific phosphatase CheC